MVREELEKSEGRCLPWIRGRISLGASWYTRSEVLFSRAVEAFSLNILLTMSRRNHQRRVAGGPDMQYVIFMLSANELRTCLLKYEKIKEMNQRCLKGANG